MLELCKNTGLKKKQRQEEAMKFPSTNKITAF